MKIEEIIKTFNGNETLKKVFISKHKISIVGDGDIFYCEKGIFKINSEKIFYQAIQEYNVINDNIGYTDELHELLQEFGVITFLTK